MTDPSPKNLVQRFFQACMLVLAGMLALYFGLQVLAQIWGWLVLIAAIVGLAWGVVVLYRWWRDRRWQP